MSARVPVVTVEPGDVLVNEDGTRATVHAVGTFPEARVCLYLSGDERWFSSWESVVVERSTVRRGRWVTVQSRENGGRQSLTVAAQPGRMARLWLRLSDWWMGVPSCRVAYPDHPVVRCSRSRGHEPTPHMAVVRNSVVLWNWNGESQ